VFDWSGTASGTPTLNLNGTTVASGVAGVGGTLTYFATSGVTLSASNTTNDVVTDSASGSSSSSSPIKLLTINSSSITDQNNNVTSTATSLTNSSGLVIDAGALLNSLIIEINRTKSLVSGDFIATEVEVTNNPSIMGIVHHEFKGRYA
jgi:hypothetical protein